MSPETIELITFLILGTIIFSAAALLFSMRIE